MGPFVLPLPSPVSATAKTRDAVVLLENLALALEQDVGRQQAPTFAGFPSESLNRSVGLVASSNTSGNPRIPSKLLTVVLDFEFDSKKSLKLPRNSLKLPRNSLKMATYQADQTISQRQARMGSANESQTTNTDCK